MIILHAGVVAKVLLRKCIPRDEGARVTGPGVHLMYIGRGV